VFPTLKLSDNITSVNKIGEKRAALYSKLGIHTVSDLVHHFPRSYIDFTSAKNISNYCIGDTVTVCAKVIEKMPPLRIRGGKQIYKLIVMDSEQNTLSVTFFNNKYAYAGLDMGKSYVFFGKLTGTPFYPELVSPIFISETKNSVMQPNYPLTAGLSHKIIATNVKEALDCLGQFSATCLPTYLLEKEGFDNDSAAFYDIHFPSNIKAAEAASKLFALEEILCLQLGMSGLKRKSRKPSQFTVSDFDAEEFIASLPFELTSAQIKAINDAVSDFKSGKSMNRLLQGDVGSGKTAVAAALFYIITKNGGQCAFMAPTEILATQHFKTLSKMLAPFNVKVYNLTASTKTSEKRQILEAMQGGEIAVLCGTHALIEDDIVFKNLALVITDEQHRFGVSQRASLISKGGYPHTLIMSATPIPRSLALTIYGDLDISVLDVLPNGRKAVKTYLINSEKRMRALKFIENEVKNGTQAYIVCPAVEQSEMEIESAVEYSEKLSNLLKDCRIGILHGKMKGAQKDAIMADFRDGKLDILVSTTVIEVGVDVSNANVMMIENAERFGLSQLHQLRGRVGRGSAQAHCILVSDSKGESASSRLSIMCKTTDGFEIAKRDLELRGPGDFFGDRQHGLPVLKSANLLSDSIILEKAQKYADEILKRDPNLSLDEHFALKQKVNSLFKNLGHSRSN